MLWIYKYTTNNGIDVKVEFDAGGSKKKAVRTLRKILNESILKGELEKIRQTTVGERPYKTEAGGNNN